MRLKKHLVKHKNKYIVGGALALGFCFGAYLMNRKFGHNEGLTVNPTLESPYHGKKGVKIIGKFTEMDGEEYESLSDLIKSKNLIGSTSADVGDVELFYDNDGNTYAVARGFEEYYGKKSK